MNTTREDLARVGGTLRAVGLWVASIDEPSSAVEHGVMEAQSALERVAAELERHEQERERFFSDPLAAAAEWEARIENAERELARLRDGLRRELDYISMRIASFTPHGMDSTRVGDYHFTADLTRAVDRARALLSASQDTPAASGGSPRA